MRQMFALAVVASLLIASSVSANLPLPKNLRYTDPVVRFEGIEKHADHVFYLRYLTFTGGPAFIP